MRTRAQLSLQLVVQLDVLGGVTQIVRAINLSIEVTIQHLRSMRNINIMEPRT